MNDLDDWLDSLGLELRYNHAHKAMGLGGGQFASTTDPEAVIYDKVLKNGGVTIDLDMREPHQGYAFAPSDNAEVVIKKAFLKPEDIDRYIDDHYEELSKSGNNLGMWTEGDSVYLDISTVGPPSPDTIAKAQSSNQLAVFDLSTFDTIDIGKRQNGQYIKLGEASDLHSQHQRKVQGATQSRSAPGTYEVPADRGSSEEGPMSGLDEWLSSLGITLRYNMVHNGPGPGGGQFGNTDETNAVASGGKNTVQGEPIIPVGQEIIPDRPSMRGKTPSKLTDGDIDTMAGNILARWDSCDDNLREAGARWYPEMADMISDVADANGFSMDRAAAITAALSPGTKWEPYNVMGAVMVMSKYGTGPGSNPDLVLPTALPGRSGKTNMQNAIRAATEEDPMKALGKGPKINSFAKNFMGDTHAVTVDVWASKAAVNDDEKVAGNLISGAGYEKVAEAYRRAAKKAGVDAPTMQATVWLHISGNRI